MLRALILSTLLIVAANAAKYHRLQFFFHFACNPSNQDIKTWKHYIELFEWDRFQNDNSWYVPREYTTSKVGPDTLVYFNVLSDGDQFLSDGYEPFLRFRHSCTNSGDMVSFEMYPSDLIPIGVQDTSVHVHYDLTNKEGFKDPYGDFWRYDSRNITHEPYGPQYPRAASLSSRGVQDASTLATFIP